ncbi:MAG: peptide chain release factor N(5)-glutamine methyltransferase [Gammaproteobacteria bacterium]|nr:peptide chain release factor N(5)-glutamine methyltransferase [Gammaproteobacteria bacterium]MBU1440596.1 peptide chain release factor N(5)-glutamine methyltransferase [Gammaproteobacteria bacterium]MBU2288157.1 peptide chain release factor N(5)-glutamine methyltransferase [Gammaproteobacteria bacterium]MBU2410734.1 peptide chain release factor N(5)-glutamine methyltransferase [Gammaproteobacteria bacterium]
MSKHLHDGSASTVGALLSAASAAGVARLDAHLLLLFALGRSLSERAWLVAHDSDEAPEAVRHTFGSITARRLAGEPVAYIVGEKEFHGLNLRVDARVLIPRPDTETLVDWALEVLADRRSPHVLDLGTGSGAIALAIQAARPDARVTGIDLSPDALQVAESNAARLGLPVRFLQGDWLGAADARWDLIVTNPPYVAAGDAHLDALRHEPLAALVSGFDGLADIRRIVQAAPKHLHPEGWLLIEHGHDQKDAVHGLLVDQGLAEVQSRRDLAGISRCTGGMWHSVK